MEWNELRECNGIQVSQLIQSIYRGMPKIPIFKIYGNLSETVIISNASNSHFAKFKKKCFTAFLIC